MRLSVMSLELTGWSEAPEENCFCVDNGFEHTLER